VRGKIFINYRRGDDPGYTGRLFDRLQQSFQRDQLFMDVDSIAPGLDFVRELEEKVTQCDVLLAVIGRGWIDARDAAGTRRLDKPDDYVRIELEAGLKPGKRVIPVLVNDSEMPRAEDLPDTLKPLARRHAVRLTHDRFGADSQGLIKQLSAALEQVEAARKAEEEASNVAARQKQLEDTKRAEELARTEKERARLQAIAGLLPEQIAKAEELANRDVQMRAEGRIRIDAKLIHNTNGVWFMPGAGATEWFQDHERGPEMVVVPAGKFMMGSPDGEGNNNEKPRHEVTIAKPLAVSRFPVTLVEWDAAQGGDRSRRAPVTGVSWEDAKAYTAWLSQETGNAYRLLTEAEWEFCCRAGTTTKYAFGDKIGRSQANFAVGWERVTEVGKFPSNAWGIYDMHGSVSEWCEDVWHENYNEAPSEGSAWSEGGDFRYRVIRGGNPFMGFGAFLGGLKVLRSAARMCWSTPGKRHEMLGFRVARNLTP
jgi:formylglycine-generating enzyme required for sulfatase activity